ncbi:hypothetical protein VTN02DRAFT_2364 [Thermoascus thermophilus]
MRITAPPSPLANSQPLLPSFLLELVHHRAYHASTEPNLPSSPAAPGAPEPRLSEQAVLTLALIDGLCSLRVDDLEEWLPLTARLVTAIRDAGMRRACVERFWDALSSGEMDVARAQFCVTWWSTRGGRELVLFGGVEAEGAYMSGAVGGVPSGSKL